MAPYSDDKVLRRKRFSLSLREARKAARMSQEALAAAITAELEDATVSQGAISRWETGTHLPERDRIPILERILDVPPGLWTAMAAGLDPGEDSGAHIADEDIVLEFATEAQIPENIRRAILEMVRPSFAEGAHIEISIKTADDD